MGFCCAIGWVPLLFVFWAVRKAFGGSLDLGD